MRFLIEQVAIAPPNPEKAIAFLKELGAVDWSKDHVCAFGKVFGDEDSNEADLAFNYNILGCAKEFEVLHYTEGNNWMNAHGPSVSHFGMHCSAEELELWRAWFAERNIHVAQEVKTLSHTNPVIAGKRTYIYAIFDTRDILGVDLKFIVRLDVPAAS